MERIMTSHDINQEFLYPKQVAEEQILIAYPGAITLLNYIVKYKKLSVGMMVVNHNQIPPMVITKEMLEYNFPSMREAINWYVLPKELQAFNFIKDIMVSGDNLELCEPSGRMKVKYNSACGHVTVSGKTSVSGEAYNFTFHELETLYKWLNIAKEFNTCIYSSLMPFNIVFETNTGEIVGVYDTPTLCDEEAAEQYRLTGRNLQYGNIHTPIGMHKNDLIGMNKSAFAY